MLQRVAKCFHKRHAILIVARRLDPQNCGTAAYSVTFASGRYMSVLQQIAELYDSQEEAMECAGQRARAYIDWLRSG